MAMQRDPASRVHRAVLKPRHRQSIRGDVYPQRALRMRPRPALIVATLVAWFSIVGAVSAPGAAAARMIAAHCCATRCHHAATVAPSDCCCHLTADRRIPAATAGSVLRFVPGLLALPMSVALRVTPPALAGESVFAAAPARAAPIYLRTESLRL